MQRMNVGKGQRLPEAAAGCELPSERYFTVSVPWAFCNLHRRRHREPPRGLHSLGPEPPGDKTQTSVSQVTLLESNDDTGSQRQP